MAMESSLDYVGWIVVLALSIGSLGSMPNPYLLAADYSLSRTWSTIIIIYRVLRSYRADVAHLSGMYRRKEAKYRVATL
jgi:hypothetical protein